MKLYNKIRALATPTFIRFCIVGIINTVVDLSIFVGLRGSGLSIVVANVISTSVGMVVSYGLNYTYTFKRLGKLSLQKGIGFFGVTLIGLWILQPIIISIAIEFNNSLGITQSVGSGEELQNSFAKLIATVCTLLWNYYFYSRYIFSSAAKPTLRHKD